MRTRDIDHELRFHIEGRTVRPEVVCLARPDDPQRSCTYARAGVYPMTTDGPCFVEESSRGMALDDILQDGVMAVRGFAAVPVTWGVRHEHGTDYALLAPVAIPSRLDQVLTTMSEMAALLDPQPDDTGPQVVDLLRRMEHLVGDDWPPTWSTGHGERFLAAFVAEFRRGHHPHGSPSDTETDARAALEKALTALRG